MPYIEYTITLLPKTEPHWLDILPALLVEQGFDSFTEQVDGILGYIDSENEGTFSMDNFITNLHEPVISSWSKKEMEDINWNEEWEKNFSPIEINDHLRIRAEFHPSKKSESCEEIIIQPKMSFGTGHHPTTHLMMEALYQMGQQNNFLEKTVLDMGCGTSVLGIYAKLHGATKVVCIDIDPWSVENSKENAIRNSADIEVIMGDAEAIPAIQFDIILANINRNILLKDIPAYLLHLKKGGILLLSGICFFDVDDILKLTNSLHLHEIARHQREEWMSMQFVFGTV